MTNISVSVKNKKATPDGSVIVCGNSDYSLVFSFDSEWDAYGVKTARFVFRKDGKTQYIDKVFNGDTVAVPLLSGIHYVLVGVFAGDLRTTTPARIPCALSVLCHAGEITEEPPEEVYNQLMEEVGLATGRINALVKSQGTGASQVHEVALSTVDSDYVTGGSATITSDGIHAVIELSGLTVSNVPALSGVRLLDIPAALAPICEKDFCDGDISGQSHGGLVFRMTNLGGAYRLSLSNPTEGTQSWVSRQSTKLLYTLANPYLPEVNDIRVGVNGAMYETAGEAVRSQLTGMGNALADLNIDLGAAYDNIETLNLRARSIEADVQATRDAVPDSVSDLENDAGFVTRTVENLTNYYLKSETYTKQEIDNKLSLIPKFSMVVVDALPTANISETTVYLVKSKDEEGNLFEEYIYQDGTWELLGNQGVDLSGYALKTDVPVNLSQLVNDSGFITREVSNLKYYYKKAEVDAMRTALESAIKDGGVSDTRKAMPNPVQLVESDGGWNVVDTLGIVPGNVYTVHWNGEEYTCEAHRADDETIVLGNGAWFDKPGNHEPFDIYAFSDGTMLINPLDGSTTATFAICDGGLRKLDYKYLDYGPRDETVLWAPAVEFNTSDDGYAHVQTTPAALGITEGMFTIGESYYVYIGDSKYKMLCAMSDDEADAAAGVYTLTEVLTGLPNANIWVSHSANIVTIAKQCAAAGTYPVKICKEVIETIPEEFIPSGGGGGGNVTTPDWGQNDETASDYIKNRTHSKTVTEDVEIAPETPLTFQGSFAVFPVASAIEAGATYTVMWDGTEYECVGVEIENRVFLGNSYFLTENEDDNTGEPFGILIGVEDGTLMGIAISIDGNEHTVKVTGDVVEYETLEPGYLDRAWLKTVIESDSRSVAKEEADNALSSARSYAALLMKTKEFDITAIIPEITVGETYTITENALSHVATMMNESVCLKFKLYGDLESENYRRKITVHPMRFASASAFSAEFSFLCTANSNYDDKVIRIKIYGNSSEFVLTATEIT